jgi:hypothetical protein
MISTVFDFFAQTIVVFDPKMVNSDMYELTVQTKAISPR